MSTHHELGKLGETIATDYLMQKGFQILEKNWRSGRAEIDIITLFKNMIVFVEVKTRSYTQFGFPEQSVNSSKQKLMVKAAGDYLYQKNIDLELRFDILSLIKNADNTFEITHFEDAFFPNPADDINSYD